MFKKVALLAMISLMLSSCLTFRAITMKVTFDKNFNKGKVKTTYRDIGSKRVEYGFKNESDSSPVFDSQDSLLTSDFDELLGWYEGDQLLLDALDRGIYVTSRKMYEKDGRLHFSYGGIFRKLRMDNDEELKILKDLITITFEIEDEVERVESNGKVERKEKLVTITWPKTEKELIWTLYYNQDESEQEPVYSLVEKYREWKNEKGSR